MPENTKFDVCWSRSYRRLFYVKPTPLSSHLDPGRTRRPQSLGPLRPGRLQEAPRRPHAPALRTRPPRTRLARRRGRPSRRPLRPHRQTLQETLLEEGLEAALRRKPQYRPSREIVFDGQFEARLLALACSDAPEGFARWTLRLLADKVVELGFAPSVSPMTVHRLLKK